LKSNQEVFFCISKKYKDEEDLQSKLIHKTERRRGKRRKTEQKESIEGERERKTSSNRP